MLSGLKQRHRTALVHITHYNNEAESADRTINLSESGDNTGMVETMAAPGSDAAMGHESGPAILELAGVSHEYDSGTPWAKTALRDVNFAVHQGDGLLIHGGNGSGKSTLAWIMAGLTIPTTGACLLDGQPTHEQVGAVALSFQAARLQLMRSRVDSGSGFGSRVFAEGPGPSRQRPGRRGVGQRVGARGASTSSAAARCAGSCWPVCWRARRGR